MTPEERELRALRAEVARLREEVRRLEDDKRAAVEENSRVWRIVARVSGNGAGARREGAEA